MGYVFLLIIVGCLGYKIYQTRKRYPL